MTKVRVLAVRGGACTIADVEKLVEEAGLSIDRTEEPRADLEGEDAPQGEQEEGAQEVLPELASPSECTHPAKTDAELPEVAPEATPGSAASSSDSEPTDDVVLVVVLHPACDADPAFESEMQTAASRGTRVIGIWPSGAEPALPAAFEDYGADTVPWDPVLLRDVVLPKAEAPQWRDPAGVSRPAPTTKRNRC